MPNGNPKNNNKGTTKAKSAKSTSLTFNKRVKRNLMIVNSIAAVAASVCIRIPHPAAKIVGLTITGVSAWHTLDVVCNTTPADE